MATKNAAQRQNVDLSKDANQQTGQQTGQQPAQQTSQQADKSLGAKIWEGMKEVGKQIGNEAIDQVKMGSHEVASTIFTGQSYVQYQRAGQDDQQPGVHGEKQAEQQKEQDRSGIEL